MKKMEKEKKHRRNEDEAKEGRKEERKEAT